METTSIHPSTAQPSTQLRAGITAARRLAIVVILLAGFVTSSFGSASAADYTYDRKAAVKYAKQYACNRNESCRNAAYTSFGDMDCTNFVSQALRAGGIPIRNNGSLAAWAPYLLSWVRVNAFLQTFEVVNHQVKYLKVKSMGAAYTPARKGDLYLYNWGKGNGWSHLSMATGWGKYGSFWDTDSAGNRVNYNQITGGRGDKMAQHATDRDGAPWNWGYQTQRNPKIRSKMGTLVVAVNSTGSV